MNGFNKVILAGNLTRDPELRYTPSGMAVVKFGLAINRKWKDQQSGAVKEDVTFVDLDAFGRTAETIGQYLKKGRPILVEGRLKLDQWEDKQTKEKRMKLGVVVETFTFLGNGEGAGSKEQGAKEQGAGSREQGGPATAGLPAGAEDEVPF